jgi:polysaccharide deacetylase 2 family uncharacterized protein YibQ
MAQPLVPAPDPKLVEQTADGPLPIIGRDGRQAWQVYARPFDAADKRPRVAVLIGGLGRDGDLTRQAIDRLPPAVTLAFNPYAQDLGAWIKKAREAGHEVLLGLPMEPTDYPREDPGPDTLLTSLDGRQNVARLDKVLGRATGYVGLAGFMGSRFTTERPSLQPILNEMKGRGLLFLDRRASDRSVAAPLARSLGLAWAVCDSSLDAEPSRDAADKALAELGEIARRNGVALGAGRLYPVTLERLGAWAALNDKGLALAPVTAIAKRQPVPAEPKR